MAFAAQVRALSSAVYFLVLFLVFDRYHGVTEFWNQRLAFVCIVVVVTAVYHRAIMRTRGIGQSKGLCLANQRRNSSPG